MTVSVEWSFPLQHDYLFAANFENFDWHSSLTKEPQDVETIKFPNPLPCVKISIYKNIVFIRKNKNDMPEEESWLNLSQQISVSTNISMLQIFAFEKKYSV